MPTGASRRFVAGQARQPSGRPVHQCGVVAGRPVDVLLVERRRLVSHLAPAVSRRNARTDYVRPHRTGRDGDHGRRQIPDHEHGPPAIEYLAARCGRRAAADRRALCCTTHDVALRYADVLPGEDETLARPDKRGALVGGRQLEAAAESAAGCGHRDLLTLP